VRFSRRFNEIPLAFFLSCIFFTLTFAEMNGFNPVKGQHYEGVIFPADYPLEYAVGSDYGRWLPGLRDIDEAEALLFSNLAESRFRDPYIKSCLPLIRENLRVYKRQYFGLLDKSGNRIVWINLFLREADNWQQELVMVDDGGYGYFNVKINLETKEVFELAINGEA